MHAASAGDAVLEADMDPASQALGTGTARIEALDLARAAALLAMAIFHFAWDLEFFGYSGPGTMAATGWKLFARAIASSFLFLAGLSLVLAHGRGVRWRGFWRRFAVVAGAALAISVVTYFAVPNGFIFFGILHQIALASLLGLAFLRLPPLLTLVLAAAVIAAPHYLRSEMFAHPAWWWLGLSPGNPRSNDYVPVFPWFGAVLAGIAVGGLAQGSGLTARLSSLRFGRWSRSLRFAGRHSLAVYLIHQPLLIGLLWLLSQIVPPATVTREARFLAQCQQGCVEIRDSAFCTRYCGCMLDTLDERSLLDPLLEGAENVSAPAVEEVAGECTLLTDTLMLEGGAE